MIAGQSLDTAVVSSLSFLGKEAARNAFIMVPVVSHTCTALSVPGAVIGAGTILLIVTELGHVHTSFL